MKTTCYAAGCEAALVGEAANAFTLVNRARAKGDAWIAIAEENGFPEDWAELPKFKRGDKVKIVRPLTDEETESYGYPEEMATCVGTVGTVLSHRFGNYEVKCPCLQRGPYYVWPESALELVTDNSKETP